MTKDEANAITGGLTQTSKMPCKSFSTPTLACVTGYKLAQVPGTVCSKCYAQKGFYRTYANTIEPAQHARLDALLTAPAGVWEAAMAALMSNDPYFRWWDSGDVPSTRALLRVAKVCDMTPDTQHWLPTREWGFVHHFLKERSVPVNLNIRMSANFPDTPVESHPIVRGASPLPLVVVVRAHPEAQLLALDDRARLFPVARELGVVPVAVQHQGYVFLHVEAGGAACQRKTLRHRPVERRAGQFACFHGASTSMVA